MLIIGNRDRIEDAAIRYRVAVVPVSLDNVVEIHIRILCLEDRCSRDLGTAETVSCRIGIVIEPLGSSACLHGDNIVRNREGIVAGLEHAVLDDERHCKVGHAIVAVPRLNTEVQICVLADVHRAVDIELDLIGNILLDHAQLLTGIRFLRSLEPVAGNRA